MNNHIIFRRIFIAILLLLAMPSYAELKSGSMEVNGKKVNIPVEHHSILKKLSPQYFLARYLSGIVFTIIHPIGNVLGFIFILPVLIQLVYKMLY